MTVLVGMVDGGADDTDVHVLLERTINGIMRQHPFFGFSLVIQIST